MENKEEKVRRRERARRAVFGAGVTQAIFAVLNVVRGAGAQDAFVFVWGLATLAVAVFFVLFKHPAWGIVNTVLYLVGRGMMLMYVLVVYAAAEVKSLLMGAVLGGVLAAAVSVYFIYADYQAVLLRGMERESEEDEEE